MNYFAMFKVSFFRIFLFSFCFGMASCLFTGFSFGVNNNIFHLPIIFNLFDLDQFKEDLFIQSLRHYSSGFWFFLNGAHRHLDIEFLFLFLFILSRIIFFLGFFLCGSLFSSLSWKDLFCLGVLTLLNPFVYGMSFAGGGGLFIDSFTHSELANGLVLIFLYFLVQRKFGFALAINGLCFFLNCFMALWNFFPFGLVSILYLFNSNYNKYFLKSFFFGLLIFGCCAWPVVSNIISNPYISSDLFFSYRDFLLFYWPYHSLAVSIPFFEYLKLVNLIIITVFCFTRLGLAGRKFLFIFKCYFLLYLFGVFISFVFPSFFMLNCHLLRSSVILHFAASIAISIYLFFLIKNAKDRCSYLFPLLLLLLLLSDITSFIFVPLMFLHEKPVLISPQKGVIFYLRKPLTILCLLLLFSRWSVFAGKNLLGSFRMNSRIGDLIELSRWIKTNTETTSVFILPTINFNADETYHLNGLSVPDRGFCDFSVFQSFSERRVYVDFKRGAAVMWCPDYFFEWKPRVDSILRYTNLNDLVYFATIEKIPYIIYDLTRYPDVPAFYKTRYFGLIKVF
jgi:hypothetical protein